jgi:Cdc6-like AAA superfamily ATPase
MQNPFSGITPEEMTAEQANQFFVEMYSDFPQIKRPGNVIITGARGCGKSMLIRCSLPDVLMLKDSKSLSELEYLALRVNVKRTSPNITDLQSLDNTHAPYLINEHCMALYVLMHSLLNLADIRFEPYDDATKKSYEYFFEQTYKRYMCLSGCKDAIEVDYTSPNEFFRSLYRHAETQQYAMIDYIARLLLNTNGVDYSYNLPLLSFLRFIVPVFKELINLPGFPKEKHVYIFIDDADNLSKTQTEILNSWLACRTQPTISIKVSTQIDQYKTYLSSAGVLVESPHDYQDINISYRYTTDITRGVNYYEKAIKILEKRLSIAGIDVDTKVFFPSYEKQEQGIKEEEEKIRKEYSTAGRGSTVYDDIRRYAIPNYIKNLGGTSKSRPTYRYAGLDNIIHLSSGIIRYLLDAAMKMYDAAKNRNPYVEILCIDTDIQDNILRNQADQFLYTELRKSDHIDDDFELAPVPIPSPTNNAEKLQNLISAMGKTFHEILVSGRSERKVFSIALTNIPDEELKSVFRLGVRLGFFHEMRIGNKDGNGRTLLYVLNRCFAPLFTLDPTGFQGYLFMTNDDLKKAITTGKQLRNISKNDVGDDDDLRQLTFEDIWEN